MSEVLSQSEIDALLNAMSSGDIDAAQVQEEAAEAIVKPFDFLRPSKFSKDQLRTMELLHETFTRSAQNHLSGALRAMVEIDVLTADQVSYGEYVNSIPTPSLITIVTMEPLEGNAVLELSLPIVFSMIDRLVGGPGTHRPRTRELTEIELALTASVVETLLHAFGEAWSEVTPERRLIALAPLDPFLHPWLLQRPPPCTTGERRRVTPRTPAVTPLGVKYGCSTCWNTW